jgi:hypothetical protein
MTWSNSPALGFAGSVAGTAGGWLASAPAGRVDRTGAGSGAARGGEGVAQALARGAGAPRGEAEGGSREDAEADAADSAVAEAGGATAGGATSTAKRVGAGRTSRTGTAPVSGTPCGPGLTRVTLTPTTTTAPSATMSAAAATALDARRLGRPRTIGAALWTAASDAGCAARSGRDELGSAIVPGVDRKATAEMGGGIDEGVIGKYESESGGSILSTDATREARVARVEPAVASTHSPTVNAGAGDTADCSARAIARAVA